jgi:hypothetical protein
MNEDYRDLLVALAGAASALTGLLFIALSLTPRSHPKLANGTARQVRSSAALLAFTNVLAVSVFGLVPNTNIGYPALVMASVGLLFTAAGARSLLASLSTTRQRFGQLGLVLFLFAIFGVELVCGIMLLTNRDGSSPAQILGYALATSLLAGVARAWEIVGDRGTGPAASIATLLGHEQHLDEPDPGGNGGSPADAKR